MSAQQPTHEVPPLSAQEERTWGMLAHASVWLHLVLPVVALVVPAVLYLAYRERSKTVAFHSLQAFLFQAIVMVGGGTLAAFAWALTGALFKTVVAFLLGILCVPIALLFSALPLAALVYGLIAAIEVYHGHPFRYPLVAHWAEELMA